MRWPLYFALTSTSKNMYSKEQRTIAACSVSCSVLVVHAYTAFMRLHSCTELSYDVGVITVLLNSPTPRGAWTCYNTRLSLLGEKEGCSYLLTQWKPPLTQTSLNRISTSVFSYSIQKIRNPCNNPSYNWKDGSDNGIWIFDLFKIMFQQRTVLGSTCAFQAFFVSEVSQEGAHLSMEHGLQKETRHHIYFKVTEANILVVTRVKICFSLIL